MFGINKKIYYIISILLFLLSITIFVLGLISVIELDKVIVLLCIAIFLFSICVIIQPYNKQFKIVTSLIKKYRPLLYKGFEDYDKGFNTVVVKENNDGRLYIDFKQRLILEELDVEEAKYILLKLIKDYIIILYCAYENNKLNLKKSTIESFTVKFNMVSKESFEVKLVDEYKNL